MKNFNSIDLFSGCGGLSQGMVKAGFNVVAGFEIDKDANQTYQLNHPGTKIVFTKKLREKDHGDLQGKKSSKKTWPDRTPEEILQFKEHGGETWVQVHSRAKAFLHETLHKHRDESVLFVTHGGLIRALLVAIRDEAPIEMLKISRLSNTSISIFDIDEDMNHHIHCLNCTKHLD